MTNTTFPAWPELLENHLSARPGAAGQLLRAASPLVTNAVRKVLSGPDADDAVQEALLDILRKASTVRDPARFGGWVRSVSTNAAHRVRRRHRHAVPVDDETLAGHAGTESVDTDAIAARLDASAIRPALAALTTRERGVVLLLADGAVSYEEASRRLGCPVGSLGPTRQRALAKLRDRHEVLAAAG